MKELKPWGERKSAIIIHNAWTNRAWLRNYRAYSHERGRETTTLGPLDHPKITSNLTRLKARKKGRNFGEVQRYAYIYLRGKGKKNGTASALAERERVHAVNHRNATARQPACDNPCDDAKRVFARYFCTWPICRKIVIGREIFKASLRELTLSFWNFFFCCVKALLYF